MNLKNFPVIYWRRFFIITILVGLIFTPMFIEGASWKDILGKMKANYSNLQTKVKDMKLQGVMLMKTPNGRKKRA